MFKNPFLLLTICFIALFSTLADANSTSPVGLWKTIDDATNKPRSLVRISDKNGELIATIEKGLLPDDSPNDVCEKCEGARKDKSLIGMVIMEGLKASGDAYEGGHILDPDNGEIYSCKIKLDATGNKLEVRGFIGVSLIGRSQIWVREE
jgi:uncharacterized protein (DUF2147 family)